MSNAPLNAPQATTPEDILAAFQRAIDLLHEVAQTEEPARGPGSAFHRLLFDAITRF